MIDQFSLAGNIGREGQSNIAGRVGSRIWIRICECMIICSLGRIREQAIVVQRTSRRVLGTEAALTTYSGWSVNITISRYSGSNKAQIIASTDHSSRGLSLDFVILSKFVEMEFNWVSNIVRPITGSKVAKSLLVN